MFKSHFLFFILFGPALLVSLPGQTVVNRTLAQTAQAGTEERDRGIELYRAKNYSDAAKLLQAAVKKNAADAQAWCYLGLALTQDERELKNASQAFENAISLRANFAAAHAGLGYVLLRRNKSSEALREARTAVSIDPGIAIAHHVIGVVQINAGAFDEALTAAREAIRLNPNLAAAYLVKSEALLGLYSGPVETFPCRYRHTSSGPPDLPVSLTPDEREERWRKRKDAEALLSQSADSLETYLRLNPSDPAATHWREQLATLKALSNIGKNDADAVKAGYEVATKARVLSKPRPYYTEQARRHRVMGTVVLHAIVASDGRVRNILVVRGLPLGLSWQAVDAARRVKFTPATLDGKPVSMFIQMEYCFAL